MEGRLSLEDFPSICRVCLIGTDLKSFSEKKYLTDLFTSITDIQVKPQDGLPKNICNNCMSKIEDISGLINMSKSNNIGFLRDLVKEEEDELHSQLESEIIIIDDGTSIKIEENSEFDGQMKNISSSVCIETDESKQKTKNKNCEQSVRERYADIFPYVCRICVAKKNLEAFSEHEHLVDVFRNLTNLVVSFQDILPKNVCRGCIQKLQNISDLIELSKSNNTKLQHILSCQQNGLCLKKSMSIHNEIRSGVDGITLKAKSVSINEGLEEATNKTRQDHLDSDNQNSLDSSKDSVDQEGQLNICRESNTCYNSKTRLIIHLKRDQIGYNGSKIWRSQICDEDFSSLSKNTLTKAQSVNKQKDHKLKTLRVVLMKEKWISDMASLIAQRRAKVEHKTSCESNATKTRSTKPSAIHSEPLLQCTICLEKFFYQHQLTVHMKIHDVDQPYTSEMYEKTHKHKHLNSHRGLKPIECHTCHKKFSRNSYLSNHMRIHTGERPFECSICQQTFTQSASLSKHKHAIHSKARDFQCSVCLNFYPTNDRLVIHMKTHSTEKKFNCSLCPKTFTLESYLRRHLKMHKPRDLIECHLCSKTFGEGINIRRHLKTHTARERTFKCAVCLKAFCSKSDLGKHLRIHRVERSFKCSVCSMGFPIEKYLKNHMKRRHLKREKSYQCTFCSKQFYHPSDLRNHQRIHKGVKRVKCKFCSKYFFHESEMLIHLRVHTGEKPYPCTLCSKRFSHKMSLTNHLIVHANERPFQCTECLKRFNKKSYLKVHMRIHTGERPYQCKICFRSFAHDGYLKIHVGIHSDIKPFKCTVCSRGFSAPTYLRVHMRIHTGEKPFKCTICPSTFAHGLTLRNHLSRHKGEKTYTCDICSKGFVIKSELASHIKRWHRQVESHCDICSRSFAKIGNLRKHISRSHPKKTIRKR